MLGQAQPDITGTIISTDYPTWANLSDLPSFGNMQNALAQLGLSNITPEVAPPSCIPQGAFGPLQPGQSYCAGGSGGGSGPSVSGINWWLLGGVLVAMVLISHHR